MKKIRQRMCIVCRERFFQGELNRFQCINKEVIKWQGVGRSFYICDNCLTDKNLYKKISAICKTDKEKSKEIAKNIKRSLLEN
jgi:predicted RNA-binding protein YlxR (DUF448 family)